MSRRSVEVLLVHVPSVNELRSSDWDSTLRSLQRRGKCEAYGVSVRSPMEAMVAMETGRPDVLQVPVSIHNSETMKLVLARARRNGIGLIGREIYWQGQLLRGLGECKAVMDKMQRSVDKLALVIQREVLDGGLVDCIVVGCTSLGHVEASFGQSNFHYSMCDVEDLRAATQRLVSEFAPTVPGSDSSDYTLCDILRYQERELEMRQGDI